MQDIVYVTLTENRACATFMVTHLAMQFLLFCKNWKEEGKVSVKHLKIRNGVLDIAKEIFTLKLMFFMLHLKQQILPFQINQCKIHVQYLFTFIILMKYTP